MHIVKYPGGKDKEMPRLLRFIPGNIKRFFDPFCGAGAPYFAVDAESWHVNDLSADLVNLWERAINRDEDLRNWMEVFADVWQETGDVLSPGHVGCDLRDVYVFYRDGHIGSDGLTHLVDVYVNIHSAELGYVSRLGGHFSRDAFLAEVKNQCVRRFKRMKELNFTKRVISDSDIDANVIGCFKKCVYLRIRDLYNSYDAMTAYRAVLYYFIRDLCFSSMFRFSNGKFNVPYGGDSYNRKDYRGVADSLFDLFSDARRVNTTITNTDWLRALPDSLDEDDFVFVDPPYDGGFSQYDGADFDAFDQRFLASWLINRCRSRFLLVVRATSLMSELYVDGTPCVNGGKLRVEYFDKRYSVSFMDRNDHDVVHMVVTNYELSDTEDGE